MTTDDIRTELGAKIRAGTVSLVLGATALIWPVYTAAQTPPSGVANGQEAAQQRECLKVARQVLGPSAKVLKCGELNQPGVLESIAEIPVMPKSHSAQGAFTKNLVILRRNAREWRIALRASRLIRNDAGYVGLEYIDDCSPFWANQVEFGSSRPDGQKGLVIGIQGRAFEEDTDPWPTEIAWDNSAGRYREITGDGAFQPEVKNPPHKCPGGVPKAAH